MFSGCPECAKSKPSNLFCVYDYNAIAKNFDPKSLASRPPTLWRYKEFLPSDHQVSMGEGMTPLIRCDRLGAQLGLNNLYVKDESRNPTWSFKDRMASVGAGMALDMGAKVLTAASSGNAGAATAAYAARAGLQAVIFTALKFPLTMRMFMQAYGAKIMATPTVPDRPTMVLKGVNEHGWFPIQTMMQPPIGACTYAIEGNKTFAYELCEQLHWQPPDVVVAPCSGGDSIAGAWRGFNEWRQLGYIDKLPRMVAAETYGILRRALDSGADQTEAVVDPPPSVAISCATTNSSYQCLRTLQDSKGAAMEASNDEIVAMQLELASTEGIWAEATAALGLAAVKKLRQRGDVDQDEVVVVWLTSGGLKDPAVMQSYVPDIPLIEPTWESFRKAAKETYSWDVELPLPPRRERVGVREPTRSSVRRPKAKGRRP
jgi:threonine synthase